MSTTTPRSPTSTAPARPSTSARPRSRPPSRRSRPPGSLSPTPSSRRRSPASSPTDGRGLTRPCAAGQPVVRFQDIAGIEVLIDVPEREVAALTQKAPKAILVRFDALAGRRRVSRPGQGVRHRDRPPDPDLSGDAASSTANPGPTCLPGMTASVPWLTGNGDTVIKRSSWCPWLRW